MISIQNEKRLPNVATQVQDFRHRTSPHLSTSPVLECQNYQSHMDSGTTGAEHPSLYRAPLYESLLLDQPLLLPPSLL